MFTRPKWASSGWRSPGVTRVSGMVFWYLKRCCTFLDLKRCWFPSSISNVVVTFWA